MPSSRAGLPSPSIEDLAHGSTVATNAVLERKGFPTAFVTTKGFRDILALQRHGRSRIYDLEYQKPKPVVTRSASFEVAERILADGTVATPLDVADVDRAPGAGAERPARYEAVAICLLNAFVNPAHERALRDLLAKALPDLHVTISSDITREFREFERASTTTLSAYVQPVIDRYIAALPAAARRRRLPRPLLGDAVERWAAAGGSHARQRHQCAAVRSGGGRGRGRAPGRPLRLQQPRHARHRRHVHGRVRGDAAACRS